MRRILHLIEPTYQGRKYLYRQELREAYNSGKDVTYVERGFYEWREDYPPDNGDNSFSFRACDGTVTTVVSEYGGTLYLVGARQIKKWCSR